MASATVLAMAGVLLGAAPRFTSVWRSPDIAQVSFAGGRLAALVITHDDSLRMAGEESLARELSERGFSAVATYRIAPKEELQSAERAKVWFEKANVAGVVVLRPISSDTRTVYLPTVWLSPTYSTLWGFYGEGWGNVYVSGSLERETVVTVETLVYSVSRNQLMWAAVSETTNPKTLPRFVDDLIKECVKELHKQGLARK